MGNVLNIWKKKYGEEEALRKWTEKIERQRNTNKKKMSEMSLEDRSKKYGTFGDNNPAKRSDVRIKISDKVAKSYINNPELKTNRSAKIKGDKNPSKQPGASDRISAHRKQYYSDPENRKKNSEITTRLHSEGKLKSGYTKNYKYLDKSSKEHIVQGSYELAFIKWLDKNNMKFRCHEDRIKYIDSIGIERTYLPDFFVEEWNSYVDVKSSYWYSIQKDKFTNIFKSNPSLNLKILLENDLKTMNIL